MKTLSTISCISVAKASFAPSHVATRRTRAATPSVLRPIPVSGIVGRRPLPGRIICVLRLFAQHADQPTLPTTESGFAIGLKKFFRESPNQVHRILPSTEFEAERCKVLSVHEEYSCSRSREAHPIEPSPRLVERLCRLEYSSEQIQRCRAVDGAKIEHQDVWIDIVAVVGAERVPAVPGVTQERPPDGPAYKQVIEPPYSDRRRDDGNCQAPHPTSFSFLSGFSLVSHVRMIREVSSAP